MTDIKEPTLNHNDTEFLCEVLKHMDGGLPKADWNAVASATGLKNAHVAQTKFGKLKKKIGVVPKSAEASASNVTPKKVIKKAAVEKNPACLGETASAQKAASPVALTMKRGTKRRAKEAFGFTAINEQSEDDDVGKPESGEKPQTSASTLKGDDYNPTVIKKESIETEV